jgi:hypothetical protein
MANRPVRFKAVLERGRNALGWTIVRLPFDPHMAWKKMQRLRIRGEVLGRKARRVEFRTSLFPVPGESGRYLMLVNKTVQREAGIAVGSVAAFSVEADLEPRGLRSCRMSWPRYWTTRPVCASTTTLLANPCGAKSANG